MSHLIREYTHSDIDGIKECIVELQEFERLMDPSRLKGMEIAHEYLEHLLKICQEEKGKIFVLELDGNIVGMVSVCIDDDKKYMRKSKKFATISDLIVLPEFRGRGIMKELLEKAEEYAKKKSITSIHANIIAENNGLVEGFSRNGYRRFEVILRKTL